MLRKLQEIIIAAVGFLLIGLVVLACVLRIHPIGSRLTDRAEKFDTGWTSENGSAAEITGTIGEPGDTVCFYRTLDGDLLNGESLCFMSTNVLFTVYLGDETIYDFHPELGGFYGKNYGDYIHTVNIPDFSGNRTVRIESTVLRNVDWTGYHEMMLQNSEAYIFGIMRANMWKFVICLCCFMFGVLMFMFCLVESRLYGNTTEALCLSVITMIMSLWSSAQTRILLLITGNSSILRVIDYAVLALMPIPFLIFVRMFTKTQKNMPVYISTALSAVNVTVQFIGVGMGLFDYADVLTVSHLLILVGMLLIAYMIVNAVRKHHIDHSQSVYLISALAVVSIAGILDMLRYYAKRVSDSSAMTRVGLIVFVGILAVYEFRQLIAVRIKSRETEVMQQLAMNDSLTGIYNRTAFVEYEKHLRSRDEGMCLFMHFDVNYLKRVNDTYGHAEGDKHIIAAARILKESFGEKGHCFRVGGDEFFVVLDGKDFAEDYAAGIETFHDRLAAYNETEKPPVPLVIAHGTAEYDCSRHNPEEAERLADSRMYEDKKRLKVKTA